MNVIELRSRICAVPRCLAPIERGHLMCKDHWSKVNEPLQRDLNAASRRIRTDRSIDTYRNYDKLRTAAITGAINGDTRETREILSKATRTVKR